MLIDIDRLRSPLGHEYLPIKDHEDDEHCSRVLGSGQQCGQTADDHHVPDAVEEYLDTMAARLGDRAQDTGHDIGTWFSLSYSNFLVLHRVLLEHMPTWWQLDFVTRLEQLQAAYRHLEHPEFEVHPCRYVEVWELSDAERKAAGITSSLDDFPEGAALPESPTGEEVAAYDTAWEQAQESEVFHDASGNELDSSDRVPIRVPDPIPHYRHGRVEPRPT